MGTDDTDPAIPTGLSACAADSLLRPLDSKAITKKGQQEQQEQQAQQGRIGPFLSAMRCDVQKGYFP